MQFYHELMQRYHFTLKLIICLFAICQLFIFPSMVSAKTRYAYDIAICAIFRDEAPYLKEWIEFHKLVGVQHFYLYNNLSTDDYLSILTPYIESNEVELTEWPFAADCPIRWYEIQTSAYNNALKKALYKSKWIAALDTDEFLFPMNTDSLVTFLKRYEKYGGLCVNWQMFGSSGIWQIPSDKLLIEMLTLGAEKHDSDNLNVKTIARPECVAYCPLCPHYFIYHHGFFQVTENKQAFEGAFPPCISVDKIRINHYWSRNEEFFYRTKVNRRNQLGEQNQEAIIRHNRMNKKESTEILRFVPALRKKMHLS